jgi:hypothetical protein
MNKKWKEFKKLLLKKANVAIKKMEIMGIDIDTPPKTKVRCFMNDYIDFGGDTWYIASKKRLSSKELELALDIDSLIDALRCCDTDGFEYAIELATELGFITAKDIPGDKNA